MSWDWILQKIENQKVPLHRHFAYSLFVHMFKNRLVKKNNTETHANCKLHSYPIWLIIWFEMTLDRVSIVGNFTFTCESHEIHLWKLGKDKKIDLSSNLKRKCMALRIHRQKEETMCWRVEGLAILRNPKLCVLVKRENIGGRCFTSNTEGIFRQSGKSEASQKSETSFLWIL